MSIECAIMTNALRIFIERMRLLRLHGADMEVFEQSAEFRSARLAARDAVNGKRLQ